MHTASQKVFARLTVSCFLLCRCALYTTYRSLHVSITSFSHPVCSYRTEIHSHTHSNMRKCGWHSADDMGSSLMGFFFLAPAFHCPVLHICAFATSLAVVRCCFLGGHDSSHTLWLVSRILNQCVIASVTSLSSRLSWWQKRNASWPQYFYFIFFLSEIKEWVVKNRFVVYNSLKLAFIVLTPDSLFSLICLLSEGMWVLYRWIPFKHLSPSLS